MALCNLTTCSKGNQFGYNLLCWFFGCFLILYGFWILIDDTRMHILNLLSPGVARNLVFSLSYGLFFIGTGMMALSLFGCCFSLETSKPMALVYVFKIPFLITVELFVIVAVLHYQNSVLHDLKPRLSKSLITNYGHANNSNVNHYGDSVFTQSIDFSQFTFNCCGIISDKDYVNTRWWNVSLASNEPRNVPLTCCAVSNIYAANSGSPIRVVQRVFHGTDGFLNGPAINQAKRALQFQAIIRVEEIWQHPQPRNEQQCQAQHNDHNPARYKQGCFLILENWLKSECYLIIITMAVLVVVETMGICFSIDIFRRLYRTA